MKLNGYYQDGALIASGSFGSVYIVPFENGVAAIAKVATIPGSRKFLSLERLLKLVNVDKTLTFDPGFNTLDTYAFFSETELNTKHSIQGGWNSTNGTADGLYTDYTQAFTGRPIQTPEMLASQTNNNVVLGVLLAGLSRQQEQTRRVGFFERVTGWRL